MPARKNNSFTPKKKLAHKRAQYATRKNTGQIFLVFTIVKNILLQFR
jgi:hypothetical protein